MLERFVNKKQTELNKNSSIGKRGPGPGGAGGAPCSTHDVISVYFRLCYVIKMDIYVNAFCSLWVVFKQQVC